MAHHGSYPHDIVPPKSELLRLRPVRPHVRQAAGLRRRYAARSARRFWISAKPAGSWMRRTSFRTPAVKLITDPALSANNPNNPTADRRLHLPRPVPRPRHDLRPDLQPGAPGRPRAHLELPHPEPRAGQRLWRRPGGSPHLYDQPATGRQVPPRGDRDARAGSMCRATARMSRSSATRATTRT